MVVDTGRQNRAADVRTEFYAGALFTLNFKQKIEHRGNSTLRLLQRVTNKATSDLTR